MSPKSVKKCRKYGYKFIYGFKQSTTVTEPVSGNSNLLTDFRKEFLYRTTKIRLAV